MTENPTLIGADEADGRGHQLELAGSADRLAVVRRRQLAVDASEVRLDSVAGHLAGDLIRVQQPNGTCRSTSVSRSESRAITGVAACTAGQRG